MKTLVQLPAPVRPPPVPRFGFVQMVLTPENRVAMFIGQKLTPDGLMAFIADAATPAGKRRSQMVRYDSLRPAPLGKPRLVADGDNARNPFAAIDAVQPPPVAVRKRAEPPPKAILPRTVRRTQVLPDDAPIPAFLRSAWPKDRDGRKLAPYSQRAALLALLAFRVWPARAARVFDVARLIEAVRVGVVSCSRDDQSMLARAASAVAMLDFGDVIKGLFAGRRYARLSWPPNRILFWDSARDAIYATHDLQRVRSWVWTPLNGEMTARDWVEVIG